MPQFFENKGWYSTSAFDAIQRSTITLNAFNLWKSIPLGTVNFPIIHSIGSNAATFTVNYSFGIYSLNNVTFSRVNSATVSTILTHGGGGVTLISSWLAFTGFQASTLPPGTWYGALVFYITTSGHSIYLLYLPMKGLMNIGVQNYFPYQLGGAGTTSIAGLAETIHTSHFQVDTQESNGFYMIISG